MGWKKQSALFRVFMKQYQSVTTRKIIGMKIEKAFLKKPGIDLVRFDTDSDADPVYNFCLAHASKRGCMNAAW